MGCCKDLRSIWCDGSDAIITNINSATEAISQLRLLHILVDNLKPLQTLGSRHSKPIIYGGLATGLIFYCGHRWQKQKLRLKQLQQQKQQQQELEQMQKQQELEQMQQELEELEELEHQQEQQQAQLLKMKQQQELQLLQQELQQQLKQHELQQQLKQQQQQQQDNWSSSRGLDEEAVKYLQLDAKLNINDTQHDNLISVLATDNVGGQVLQSMENPNSSN